ncbi:MAG: glycosyltransferase [Proteobacteria bacterium]|nr:glycosyltransferase [Pseudomonadota bacterium]
MQAPTPIVHVDLTTSYEERGRIAHGTTRVERGIVGALADMDRPSLRFCYFNGANERFTEIDAGLASEVVRAPTSLERRRDSRPSWHGHPVLKVGQAVERWLRVNLRDPLRRRRSELARKIAPAENTFATGHWLLLPGELQRQDFRALLRLKLNVGVRLAFVFYDLLGTLSADDPRMQDAGATDLPASEFILRHASLILPISQYSADEISNHARARGRALPRLRVIRLGHRVSAPQPAAAGAGTPGLRPRGFVLAVGDMTARKNQAMLINIWRSLVAERGDAVAPLVIVGRVGHEGSALVAATLADAHLGGAIRFVSNADDATLLWLYRNCRFSVLPSFAEGFGLPIVESLAQGRPCIASNAMAMPEASQNLALHLAPGDQVAWRDAIARLIDDDELLQQHERRIRDGFRPATWDESARDVLDAITQAARA